MSLSLYKSTPKKKKNIALNESCAQHLLHTAVLEEDASILSSLLDLLPANIRVSTQELDVAFATDLDHLRYAKFLLNNLNNNNDDDDDDNNNNTSDKNYNNVSDKNYNNNSENNNNGKNNNNNNNKNNKDKKDIVDLGSILSKTTTCLHLAAMLGDVRKAGLLLDKGAHVNARMEDGVTALMVAASHGRVEVAELLLERGADVDRQTLWGRTALHYAVQSRQLPLSLALLQNRADPNIEDREGLRPLHLAAKDGRADLVLLLVEFGADVNAKSKNGAAPVHFAVAMGWTDVLEVLLVQGAKVEDVMKEDGELDLQMFDRLEERQKERRVRMCKEYQRMIRETGWRSRLLVKLAAVARSAFRFADETF